MSVEDENVGEYAKYDIVTVKNLVTLTHLNVLERACAWMVQKQA